MATSEIEKLERRYAENPHGLTFAPLAEVHRKTGDVPRALELLIAGLELHPNYIPASIVLGRCHQDLGDLPAAEAAFAHVLRLDDENVIALKSLADINERLDRFGEAVSWLRRLVTVDRSNDEAREQLRHLEARKKEAGVAAEPAVASTPALEVIDLGPELADGSPGPVAAADEPKATPAELLPVELAALEPIRSTADHGRSEAENARPQAELTESSTPVPDVATAGPVASPAPAASASEPEEQAPDHEEPTPVAPMAGLISAEFEPPLEAIGGLGVETSEDLVLDASGNTEFRVPDASEDFKTLADRLSAPSQRPPATALPEAPQKIVEEVSATTAEPTPDAAAPTEEENTIGLPPARRSYLARETNGRSVASFFRSLLAAHLPTDGSLSGAGNGSEGGDDASAGPVPPAVPAADKTADTAVSFDDFFASEREGSTPSRQRADPGKDDLDQFQTWLQNLKR